MSLPNNTLESAYEAMTPGSARLAAEARTLFPSGLTHDSRHFDPYPIYVTRAQGPVSRTSRPPGGKAARRCSFSQASLAP